MNDWSPQLGSIILTIVSIFESQWLLERVDWSVAAYQGDPPGRSSTNQVSRCIINLCVSVWKAPCPGWTGRNGGEVMIIIRMYLCSRIPSAIVLHRDANRDGKPQGRRCINTMRASSICVQGYIFCGLFCRWMPLSLNDRTEHSWCVKSPLLPYIYIYI